MSETNGNETIERGAIPMGVLMTKRNSRSLRWYERQWGSGFIAGIQVGVAVGIGIAIPVAFVAKWLVTAWFAR